MRNPTKCAPPGLKPGRPSAVNRMAGQKERPYRSQVGRRNCLSLERSNLLSFALAAKRRPPIEATESRPRHERSGTPDDWRDTADAADGTVIAARRDDDEPSAAARPDGLHAASGIGKSNTRWKLQLEADRLSRQQQARDRRTGSADAARQARCADRSSWASRPRQIDRSAARTRSTSTPSPPATASEGAASKAASAPNSTTGQLTVTFNKNNPQAPFNEVILHFNGGAFAPIANPLACGTAKRKRAFASFSGKRDCRSAKRPSRPKAAPRRRSPPPRPHPRCPRRVAATRPSRSH